MIRRAAVLALVLAAALAPRRPAAATATSAWVVAADAPGAPPATAPADGPPRDAAGEEGSEGESNGGGPHATDAPAAVRHLAPPPPDVRLRPSWFALPVVFWLPETRLGMGGSAGFHFHVKRAERASSIFVVGAYTLQRQGLFDASADVAFPRGGAVATRLRAVYFPDAFYGLGPQSLTSAREPFTRRVVEGVLSAEYPVARRLRLGPRVDARVEEIGDLAPGGLLASGTIPGSRGFGAVGVGVTLTYDTRDRPLFPRRGAFAQGWILHHPGAIGGGHETFTHGAVEGRLFLPLGRERVLGVAAFLEDASAETPFTILPKLGSTRFLRGWREGRFRDRVAWAAQAELRVPLTDRLWGAVFGAFGEVEPSLRAITANDLRVAGGGGLRVRLTREGANVRFDVAASDAGPEVYVLVLEAF